MAVKLNKRGFKHAKELIKEGHVVIDERDAGSEHQPSTKQENEFIEKHGYGEYGKWHLGFDEKRENTKGSYKFPTATSRMYTAVECSPLKAEAGQYKYFDIENAAAHLHGMIDAIGQ